MKAKQLQKNSIIFVITVLLSSCAVGPDYVRPPVVAPLKYKEANKNWKIAQPKDEYDRGPWWQMFHDAELNRLELQLNQANQSIAVAQAQYPQAQALVAEAEASFFPTITGSALITRQRQGGSGSGTFVSSASSSAASSAIGSPTGGGTGAYSTTTAGEGNPANSHSLFVGASWEPDMWGSVRRQVEANVASAQASAASLAAVRLSMQTTLAADYFSLRTLDNDQKVLDDTVKDDKKALQLTQYRYQAGVAARTDVIQAQAQLEGAEAAAINNGVARAQFEHAIAVLIGIPASNFKITAVPCLQHPPTLPIEIPSVLLERRPDVAQAERLAASANAQIGIAVTAYYPVLSLSGTGNVSNPGFAHWFSLPDLSWALGGQLADTLFDAGLRRATVEAARANYLATVATYRQTVLAAFQNVEDNMAALRILLAEEKVQDKAARDARYAFKLVLNEYKAGTAVYTDVIVAQLNAYNAEKTAADVRGQEMTAAVALIAALGGGWNVSSILNNR